MDLKNVLVTASGGLVGQGVLRSLQNHWRLITGDPDINCRGHLLGDCKVILPMADDPEYTEKILEICKSENISYIIIGSDTELMNFAVSRKRFSDIGVKVIVSDPTVVGIADDKLLTAMWLRQNDFPYPQTISLEGLNDEFKNFPFPAIVKPKNGGRRSYGVTRVNNIKELTNMWLQSKVINVVQEELQGDEFTAGVLVIDSCAKAVCVLKRDLRDGNTFNAYHDKSCDTFIPKLTEIAQTLKPEGPCNFQFRIKDNEPVIFEINARFSGTTPLRAMFGFNEVKSLLEFYEFKTPIEWPKLKDGTVFRTTSDVFVDENEIIEFPFGVKVNG